MEPTQLTLSEFACIFGIQKRYDHFPRMHREICEWLEDSLPRRKRLLMAYRHAGKSELVAIYVAWRLYTDPNLTFLIISADNERAGKMSELIRKIIETHPFTTHLVPELNETKWQSYKFTVKRDIVSQEPSVLCRTIGTGTTGFHADEVVVDDIEIADNCRTQEARKKIRDTTREIVTSVGRKTFLFIGTPHDDDSIYTWLEHKRGFETRKWAVWRSDGKPQMPEIGHDERWIAEKQMGEEGEAATSGWFKSQYLLIPSKAYETLMDWNGVQIYDAEPTHRDRWNESHEQLMPTYYLRGEEILDVKAYWDPATGLQGKDNSVIALAVQGIDGNVYLHDLKVLPPYTPRTGFADQINEVLFFLKTHEVPVVYVEKNFAFQLADELRKTAKSQHIRVSVRETTRKSSQNKKVFIAQQLEPLVKTLRLWVHQRVLKSPFREEFESFPSSRKDDCIDAAAGAFAELRYSGTGWNGTEKPIASRNWHWIEPIQGMKWSPTEHSFERVD
jgi:phage terminase large subunit-like protein